MNVICSGHINTETVREMPKDALKKLILPLAGRLGERKGVARRRPASDEAGFVTRSTLSANGGQVMVCALRDR